MPPEDKEKIISEAEKFLKQGMLDRVESVYRRILSSPQVDTGLLNRIGDLYVRYGKVSESVKCLKQLAEYYERKGFEPQAAAIWKKIIKLNPMEFEANVRLADIYQGKKLTMDAKRNYLNAAKGFFDRGDYKSAIKAYEKLRQLEPENLKIEEEIAMILIQLGQHDSAAEKFVHIAQDLENSGNIEDSIKTFRRAVSLDPRFLKELGEFIRRIFAKGMTQESMLLAEDLFMSMPERGETAAILADLFIEQKNYSDAHKILNKALEGNVFSQYLIKKTYGRLLKEQGESEQSFDWFSKAADDLIQDSDLEGAVTVMSEFLEGSPDNIRGLEKLLEICKSTGNQEKIVQCCKRLEDAYHKAGMDDKSSFIREEIDRIAPGLEATAEDFLEQKEEEIVEGEEIVGPLRKEEFIDEQSVLSRIYTRYDMHDRAVLHLERILDKFPEECEVIEELIGSLGSAGEKEQAAARAVELADRYRKDGKREKAIAILRKASDIHPDDAGIAVMLEEISGKRSAATVSTGPAPAEQAKKTFKGKEEVEIRIEDEGESAERITTVEEMLLAFRDKVKQDVAEDDYKTHYDLGIAYKEMDLIDEAIGEFQHARLSSQYFADGSLMLSLCYSKKGNIRNAETILEESIREINDEKKALGLKYELAEIYGKLGKLVDSYNIYSQIIETDPSFRDAQERAKELFAKLK